MITIAIARHITVEQLINWKKKGALIESNGFNFYAVTDKSCLANLILQCNRDKKWER